MLMKKILFVETSAFRGYGGGGSFIQTQYYLNLLPKKGFAVELYWGNPQENYHYRIWKIIKKIKKTDYIIGFGTPLLCSYLQWLCFFLNKKGIFCLDTYISSREIFFDHLQRRLFPTKLIFHIVIASLLNKFFSFFLPPKLKLVNITSCKYISGRLRFSRYHILEDNHLYPRIIVNHKKNTISNKEKNVLFYGTLYRGRGVIDLVRAARILWSKGYHFRLSILGFPIDYYTQKNLNQEIRKEEKGKITLKGKVAQIKKYVKAATVVVLPFRYPCSFQTPYTLIEPMTWGVPVITTDVGSHKEWIKDGETGLFCRKADVWDLADKIEMIFNNSKLVNRLTTNALGLVRERMKQSDLLLKILTNET